MDIPVPHLKWYLPHLNWARQCSLPHMATELLPLWGEEGQKEERGGGRRKGCMGTRGGGSSIEGYKEQRNVVYTLEGEIFMRVTGALCKYAMWQPRPNSQKPPFSSDYRKWCSSHHLSWNLIGLHSWLQWDKSVYRLDSRPPLCVCMWRSDEVWCQITRLCHERSELTNWPLVHAGYEYVHITIYTTFRDISS